MSGGRRPGMGPALGPPYQPHPSYMGGQQGGMPPMGPGQQGQPLQRFMMGGPQMGGQMYGPGPTGQPVAPQMYGGGMPPVSHPGPPVSPAARPPTPQHMQQQHHLQQQHPNMQAIMQNSPKQPSPAPSVSSDHGSTHSNKQGEDGLDIKMEPGNPDDPGGDANRAHPRPVPSPVGSTGSRSNTPASLPGGAAGSAMPVRPSSGQVDGQNRMTQSPMATQGYSQQMMPPPNSMGYMPTPGKMAPGGAPMPGHYPQYNSQYPQGNYGRQQPGMPGMGGPPMSGPMQGYPNSQPGMYPGGPPQMSGQMPMQGQMGGPPMYNSSMNRGGQGGYYPAQPGMMGGNGQYPPYSSPHIGGGPMPPHGMPPQQQGPPGMMHGQMPQTAPASSASPAPYNKASQAAQAAMMAAANTMSPRSMSSSRGTMSPSRGMFSQSPLAQMNNMSNSPNLGSPSLNSMSNAVEQLARNMPPNSSSPSPGPKPSTLSGNGPSNSPNPSGVAHSGADGHTSSPMSNNTTDYPDPTSRPNSTSAGPPSAGGQPPPELTTNESTTGSDSSSGAPSDSTSVDSGFHSSDQGDSKPSSDSLSSGQSGFSPPPHQQQQPNGEHHPPPHPHQHQHPYQQLSHPPHPYPHQQHQQQQQQHMMHYPHHPPPHMSDSNNKMPYNSAGVPLPPSSISSASMPPMPAASSVATTTASSGPMPTSVTQSIASPVTSVSTTSHPSSHPQPPHHMGGPHGPPPPHMMAGHHPNMPPHHGGGMMPNGGMPPNSMMPPGPHMGPHGMMQPHSMNGPMMPPGGHMMGHNGPMMPNPTGNMPPPPMGHMGPQQPNPGHMPPVSMNNTGSNNNGPSDDVPEVKKKKHKEMDMSRHMAGPPAHMHNTEDPSSPGGFVSGCTQLANVSPLYCGSFVLSKANDVNKLYEMGTEPDRRPFIEGVLSFLEESGQPVTAMPVISKTPIDLYKLYFCVREKGGFEEVTRNKKWRDICQVVNIGTSASAAFTLKKNYIRYLFNYECKFDRGGINPGPILAQMEAQLAHKRESKSKRAPSPAGSTNSNDSFRPPSVPNSAGDASFHPGMQPPPYMQQGGPLMTGPDGSPMPPNPHMSGGSMMMGPGGPMMGGPPPSGMMGGPPGPPPGMMGGPPMMGQGGYNGGHMMPGGPPPPPQQGGPPNSVSVQDPFSDESSYRPTPPPSSTGHPTPPPQSTANSSGDHTGPSEGATPGPQFPFNQKFERPDRYDQSSPSLGSRPPDGAAPGQMRYPAPQYPPQGGPPYQGSQYPPPFSQHGPPHTPAGGHYSGPRPAGPPSGPMYGTPSKRFPDDHSDRSQWSPMQRSRHSGAGQGYLPPLSPSSSPMGPYSRQLASSSRERYPHKMPPAYGGQLSASMGKKELSFPPDCVESVGIATTKRKRLTHKDLAPFEAWRLMLSLKSGLLAESTWALDTLNILLYDDATYGYFNLNTLPGLLEVLTEHFRHCLIAMFEGFDDLEAGQTSRRPTYSRSKWTDRKLQEKESSTTPRPEDEKSVQLLTGANYTMVSRKGLPVKLDSSPADSSVLESKDWDVYSCFTTPSNHWSEGCGDITEHILTHLESTSSNQFMAAKFKRKRALEEGDSDSSTTLISLSQQDNKRSKLGQAEQLSSDVDGSSSAEDLLRKVIKSEENGCNTESKSELSLKDVKTADPEQQKSSLQESNKDSEAKIPNLVCNGKQSDTKPNCESSDIVQVKQEPVDPEDKTDKSEKSRKEPTCNGKKIGDVLSKQDIGMPVKPLENGDIEQPKLSPMVNHLDKNINSSQTKPCKDSDEGSDVSPPVLKAEVCLDGDEMEVEGDTSEPLNSTMKDSSEGASMEADASIVEGGDEGESKQADEGKEAEDCNKSKSVLNESYGLVTAETEELSYSFVAEMMKEEEPLEEEAYQRDDPPLCVTPEDKDELGRRCVAISNIFRSLSCVPGNETAISKHAGIMRVLGKLLLLQHSHPTKPAPRKLPHEEEVEEEKEEEAPPRVYDDEHWWWDYLDQLRENTLVILANICGHLHLANFSESVCFPLLEGLIHWLTCPASVARDPLPTLGASSVLSPERLVLEALCKLCIHENNVDLLLATAHIKRLLSLYSTLVRFLSDRHHQIPREFSIVLLSLLVPADCTVARAVALQPPSVALLVDFLETAEQAALSIASQQGVEALQANPEAMGTSLDMLRRAASILLNLARVPDNRKMFLPQQSRLLNLVMSQILDQTVSNTLAEVLFECSQFS